MAMFIILFEHQLWHQHVVSPSGVQVWPASFLTEHLARLIGPLLKPDLSTVINTPHVLLPRQVQACAVPIKMVVIDTLECWAIGASAALAPAVVAACAPPWLRLSDVCLDCPCSHC